MKTTTKTGRSFGRLALALFCLSLLSTTQLAFAQTTLWRVGKEDNSKAEFPANPKIAPPATYAIPGDWNTQASFPEWSGASNGDWDSDRNFDTTISYSLAGVPANGAEFHFKTLNASQFVPQLAVFSNGKLAGIINMMGTRYFGTPNPGTVIPFGDLFRVYIPKEFLVAGANTLRIKKLEHPFSSASGSVMGGANFPYLSFEYDFFKLVSLSSPASEPIHGRYINLSAESQTSSTTGSFAITDAEVANRPQALKWLGVAYSGNMDRAVFWRDVAAQQPRRLEYLQMLRDMNMQVLMDYYSRTRDPQQTANTAEWTVDANGVLLGGPRTDLTNFFNQYGNLFQYYELSNEPTMQFSNESLSAQKAIADFLNTIRPAHVKVTAPGYNYAYQNYGSPAGWDGNSQDLLRRDLETRTQATNGHSYNDSYRQSFAETLDTYKDQFPNGYTNGLPKEFVNSEFGTNDGMNSAFDDSGLAEGHAQTFDRILRAHLAFGSKFSVYGAGDDNGSFQLFDGISPAAWTAHTNPNGSGETLRLKIFRQYALAYATHGKPLPFSFLNEGAVTDKLAYVRAVDTSTLAPLPGSGGTSNKILVNFVNFDKVAQTISVRVTMPQNGTYSGERFGPEDTYTAARSAVSFVANPTIDLTVNLGPRESVQYILAPSVTLRTPENPAGAVNGVDYKYYEGTWSQLPSFAALTPIKSGTLANFSLTSANRADNFGFSCNGYVEVPTDGTYTLTTKSDDGSKLFIGTTEVVSNDGLHAAIEKSGTLGLKAGKHAFKVVFFEATGGEVLQVSYAGPGISKQPIPNSKLWRAPPGSGNGTGLKGQYFNGTNFNTIVQTRTDAKIDFNWPGAPMSSVNEDDFSVRWTGKVEPRYSQAYTFLTSNDDGVRLWVDGQLLIDKWISGVNNWSATTPVLNANQLYDIKMEYYEGGGGAKAKLEWQSASQSREVVPQSQLYPMDTLTNGLVGWWKLDENSGTVASDSSGSGKNGTVTSVTWNPSSGKIGGSAQFSGSAARIILPDETFRGIGTTQSVACWFKSSSTGVIVGVQNTDYPTNPSSWNPVLWIGTDGKLRGQIWMGNNNLAVASSGVVNNGAWHHVALVASGNNQIVYLNGTALGSVAGNLGWSGKNQFGVGYTASWPSGNGSWMSYAGSLDDVRQYNRALTASEVAALATG